MFTGLFHEEMRKQITLRPRYDDNLAARVIGMFVVRRGGRRSVTLCSPFVQRKSIIEEMNEARTRLTKATTLCTT